jgi:phenylacetate-CoA ligase
MLATLETITEATQPQRMEAVLPRWLEEVPLYQASGPRFVASGASFTGPEFGRFPLITKADIRANFPKNFLRNGWDLEALQDDGLVELEHTSGTSEVRTPLILAQGWWAEQERRALELNPLVAEILKHGVPRRVTINSPSCSNDICYTGVPAMSDRIVGDSLHVTLSRQPFLWGEEDLARMAAEAAEWNPAFLDVDPVYGAVFALYCERKGIRFPSLKFILASYEYVSVVHRAILERVFRVPVFNLYGSTETGHLLMEVEPGELRPSLETAFLEVADPDEAGAGNLVVTTLTNDYMPLIRYGIGDLVRRRESSYSTRYQVLGRAADALKAKDGRRVTVWDLDQCFREAQGIAHYQVSQPSPGSYLLRYVAEASGPAGATVEDLRKRMGSLLGDENSVDTQAVGGLLPESSGKFRLCYPGTR